MVSEGEADRQAATIKGHIGIYLNEGHDVNSPAQMKEAIESYGGISGVSVKYVKIPELSSNNPIIKWDGISTLNNFQFHPSGVQVWKAYKIGPGKHFPWSHIQCDSSSSCPLEVLESPVQTQRSCFRVVRARRDQTSTGSKGFSSSCQHSERIEDGVVMAQESGIFSCPEESCIKTFQRSSALQAHLDEGRHKHALEKEPLLDKAKRGYATKITGERTQVPTVGFRSAASQGAVAPLQMGWALKTAKKRTMFSQEQKKYVTEQFVIGEESGNKADPKQVSQDMRKVRSESGVRLFLGKDVLSSQQVSGFFSLFFSLFFLAAKIRKASPTEPEKPESDDDEQQNAVEAESLHSQLHEVVRDEVALRHSIVSLSRNICNLVNANKLSSLSVGMLKEICESLGLNVDDIKQRRKKPLIERISQVVGECSCSRK